MHFHIVKFERLKKREEAFENERVGVEIMISEDEDEDEAMAMAKQFVARHLGEGLKIQDAQDKLQELADMGLSQEALTKVAEEFSDQVRNANSRKLFPSLGVSEEDRS
jgi:protein-disulfide isomerase-like protein with CxxC motif